MRWVWKVCKEDILRKGKSVEGHLPFIGISSSQAFQPSLMLPHIQLIIQTSLGFTMFSWIQAVRFGASFSTFHSLQNVQDKKINTPKYYFLNMSCNTQLKGPTSYQPEIAFWDINFKIFLKKQRMHNPDPPPFPTQEIRTEKSVPGKRF